MKTNEKDRAAHHLTVSYGMYEHLHSILGR